MAPCNFRTDPIGLFHKNNQLLSIDAKRYGLFQYRLRQEFLLLLGRPIFHCSQASAVFHPSMHPKVR